MGGGDGGVERVSQIGPFFGPMIDVSSQPAFFSPLPGIRGNYRFATRRRLLFPCSLSPFARSRGIRVCVHTVYTFVQRRQRGIAALLRCIDQTTGRASPRPTISRWNAIQFNALELALVRDDLRREKDRRDRETTTGRKSPVAFAARRRSADPAERRAKCMSRSGGAIKQQFIGFPIVGISMWIR